MTTRPPIPPEPILPGSAPPDPPPTEGPFPGPPQPAGIGAWVSEGWRLVQNNLGMAIVMMLVPAVPSIIAGVILTVAGVPAAMSSSNDLGQMLGAGSMLIGSIVAFVFLIVVMPALYLGILSCFWDMLQTGRLTFDRIMAGLPVFGAAIGLGIIFAFINVVLSAVAGVIPIVGALVGFALAFPLAAWTALAFYHMAVNSVGAIDALSFGWSQLMADFWTLSLLGVVTWLITMAGMVACGVGVLIAAPVTYAAWGACYRDKAGAARPVE